MSRPHTNSRNGSPRSPGRPRAGQIAARPRVDSTEPEALDREVDAAIATMATGEAGQPRRRSRREPVAERDLVAAVDRAARLWPDRRAWTFDPGES